MELKLFGKVLQIDDNTDGNSTQQGAFNLRIISMPKLPDQYKELVELNLSQSRLDYLPNEIGELRCLTSLDASNNNLIDLPEELGSLSTLKYLNLMSNRFELFLETLICSVASLLDRQDCIHHPIVSPAPGCSCPKSCTTILEIQVRSNMQVLVVSILGLMSSHLWDRQNLGCKATNHVRGLLEEA
jgi:Leucine-rich repeat (LRR) protein